MALVTKGEKTEMPPRNRSEKDTIDMGGPAPAPAQAQKRVAAYAWEIKMKKTLSV